MTVRELLTDIDKVDKAKMIKTVKILIEVFFDLIIELSDYLSTDEIAKYYVLFVSGLAISEEANIDLHNLLKKKVNEATYKKN